MGLWLKLIARASLTAGFVVALLPIGGAADPVGELSAPARVTTDTPEYCRHLARLYDRPHRPGGDNDELARDGAEMCEQGRVRLGVRALRRALAGVHAQP